MAQLLQLCFTSIVLVTTFINTISITWIHTARMFPIAYLPGHQGLFAEHAVQCRRLFGNPQGSNKSLFYGLFPPQLRAQRVKIRTKVMNPFQKPAYPAEQQPFRSAHILNSDSRIEPYSLAK